MIHNEIPNKNNMNAEVMMVHDCWYQLTSNKSILICNQNIFKDIPLK